VLSAWWTFEDSGEIDVDGIVVAEMLAAVRP